MVNMVYNFILESANADLIEKQEAWNMQKEYEIKYYINHSNTCTTTVQAPNTQTAAAIAKSMLPTATFIGQPREKR